MPQVDAFSSATKSSENTSTNADSSVVGEFFHAAAYSAVQSPLFGITQLIDKVADTKLAANIHLVDAVQSADFGTAKWHAQQFGASVGMILPFCAVAKFTGGSASLAAETSFARQVTRSAVSGFVFDAVCTPVAIDDNFWSSRLKNGLVGGATFATLTGFSTGAARFDVLKNRTAGSFVEIARDATLGAASGVPAGIVNSELSSFVNTGKSASLKEVAESVYTMTVIGGGLGAAHSRSVIEKADHMLGKTYSGMQKIGVGAVRNFEIITSPREFALSLASVKESVDLFAGKNNDHQIIQRAFEQKLEQKENNHLQRFSEKIMEKFNVEPISKRDLHKIIEAIPASDRKLALTILEQSLPNSSEVFFAQRMKSLRSAIEQQFSDEEFKHVATGGASWGRAFSYCYKKLSLQTNRIFPQALENLAPNTKKIIIFDDINTTTYNPVQIERLAKLDKVVVADIGSFEKGINFVDFSLGYQAVAAKMKLLVTEAKQILANDKSLNNEQVVQNVLKGDIRARALSFNPRSVIITPDEGAVDVQIKTFKASTAYDTSIAGRVSVIHDLLSFPKIDPVKLQAFFDDNYVAANREPAAYILAEGAQNITYKDMIALSRKLHKQIVSESAKKNIGENDIVFHEDNSGDSVYLINYLHRLANGLPTSQFKSAPELIDLASGGKLQNKALVLLDDASYTGSKLDHRMSDLASSANQAGAVLTGTLAQYSTPQFENSVKGVQYLSASTLNSSLIAGEAVKWKGATSKQLEKVNALSQDSGFSVGIWNDLRMDYMGPTSSINSALIWPFGVPDNDVSVVRKFANKVLNLRQVIDPEGKQLSPTMAGHTAPLESVPDFTNLIATGKTKLLDSENRFDNSISVEVAAGGSKLVAEGYSVRSFSTDVVAAQKTAKQLSEMLKLSPGYPAFAVRQIKFERSPNPVDCLLLEKLEGEPLSVGLSNLSSGAEFDRQGPSILRTDPEIRQKVERALLEVMLFDIGYSAREMSMFKTNADGSVTVRNKPMIWSQSRSSKPQWNGIESSVAYGFSESFLTNDSFLRLKEFYSFINSPSGKATLDAMPVSRFARESFIERLEWFIEHKRFPGIRENQPLG